MPARAILKLGSLLLVLFSVACAPATRNKTYIIQNKDCEKTDSCSLKRVVYGVEDYKVILKEGGENFGTKFFIRYETDSLSTLEDYVFVQYIKGCEFKSSVENGKLLIEQPYSRVYDDKSSVPFKFISWTVDSNDDDPVYNSFPGLDRHYLYRWNEDQDSINQKTEKLYGDEAPLTPALYVIDRPGTAFLGKTGAKNISLKLKMCIYRSKDVPMTWDRNKPLLAKPIHCYEWSTSFVFNHKKNKFKNPKKIAQACKTPNLP